MGKVDETQRPFDAIVIGSGFGGAVTAARLVEAGLDVCLLERGRRFEPDDFPESPSAEQVLPDFERWRWSPRRSELGLWETRDLGDLWSVQAAGYGGGSLIYANVHLRAPDETFAQGWPEGWSRKELDPYYDLVAEQIGLEVAPDTIRNETGDELEIRKADQMKRASGALGRPWVKFPLAVRFGQDGATEGRGRCVGCGACDTGCSYGAKKTLDQNYLEVVDRAANNAREASDTNEASAAAQRVEVLTLAEATRIEASGRDTPFTVHYRDHLVLEGEYGRENAPMRTVCAKHVFVCAGALGSTELLARSAHAGLEGLNEERLGEGFRANLDSLGVVFDTAEEQRPDVGPTITGGMVYQGPSILTAAGVTPKPKDADVFLLVEDGGYSLPVASAFQAAFRSPLWLGRNRFDTRDPSSTEEGARRDESWIASAGAPALGPPKGGRPNAALPVALYRVLVANQLSPKLRKLVTDQLERLKQRATPMYEREESALLDAIFAQMADDMPTLLANQSALARLFFWLMPCLRRPTRRLTLRFLRAATPAIKEVTRDAILARYGLDDPAHLAGTALRLAAGDRSASFVVPKDEAPDPDPVARARDHVTVLLSMGRDHGSGKLVVPTEEGRRTRVDLTLPRGAPAYATQEALLRDVARELRGELRLNPDWSTGRRPVTVHPQGGCAMADAKVAGVTDGSGQVFGVPGLYVFDASAFPASVGVNPSHTIAALAERNVESFLREHLENDHPWMEKRSAAKERARAWVCTFEEGEHSLDPLRLPLQQRSKRPTAEPVGVRFKEAMVGFVARAEGRETLPTAEAIDLGECLEAQRRGRVAGTSLKLDLTAEARDLRYFLDGPPHQMTLIGKARLGRPSGESDAKLQEREHDVVGTLELMGMTNGRRNMTYELYLAGDDNESRTTTPWLRGFKEVSDDVGADAYADTTTLHVAFTEEEEAWLGVVRVPLDTFLEEQLPSMEAIGTDEDFAAGAWALAEFGTFFFGHLAHTYGADILAVAKSVGRRWTGQARSLGLTRPEHTSRTPGEKR